jgi:hypothetical protein
MSEKTIEQCVKDIRLRFLKQGRDPWVELAKHEKVLEDAKADHPFDENEQSSHRLSGFRGYMS